MSIGLIQQPEEVFNRLEIEAQKYQDVCTIYKKLKAQGSIAQIYQVFQQVFQNEHDFTISELTKLAIQQQKLQNNNNAKFDFCEHYKMNSQIFKSNLTLISQIVIEDLWMFYNMSLISSVNDNSQDSTQQQQQKQNESINNNPNDINNNNENNNILQQDQNQNNADQQNIQKNDQNQEQFYENQAYYDENQQLQQQQTEQAYVAMIQQKQLQQQELLKHQFQNYSNQQVQQKNVISNQDYFDPEIIQQQQQLQNNINNADSDQQNLEQQLQPQETLTKSSQVIEKMNISNLNKNLMHIISYHPSLDFQMPNSSNFSNAGSQTLNLNNNNNNNLNNTDSSVKIGDRYQINDYYSQAQQFPGSTQHFSQRSMLSPQAATRVERQQNNSNIDQYFQKINTLKSSNTQPLLNTQQVQLQNSIQQQQLQNKHSNNNSLSMRKSNVLNQNANNESNVNQSNYSPNNKNSSIANINNTTKNVPLEYSEFTYSKSGNKFTVSQRKLTQPNNPHSPGPCAYNIKKDLLDKRTVGGTIPRSQKISIFDQQVLSNRVVDRLYYPSEHAIYKPMKKE